MKFHAVYRGPKLGIVVSDDEVRKMAKSYYGFRKKTFATEHEAVAFLKTKGIHVSVTEIIKTDDHDDNYYVVCNGRKVGIFRSFNFMRHLVDGLDGTQYKVMTTALNAYRYFDKNVSTAKYYAVRKGLQPGIYVNSQDFQQAMKCASEGKAFENLRDAFEYMGYEIIEKSCVAYIDGSYYHQNQSIGCGIVLLNGNKTIELSETTDDSTFIEHESVGAEILAAKIAIQKAIEMGFDSITLHHDWEGISEWVQRKNFVSTDGKSLRCAYRKMFYDFSEKIEINFVKVKGHSGDEFNTRADQLAKQAHIA